MKKMILALSVFCFAELAAADVTFVAGAAVIGDTVKTVSESCYYGGKAFHPGDQVVNPGSNLRQVCTSDLHGASWMTVEAAPQPGGSHDVSYSVSTTEPDFVPSRVYSDGAFTYIQFGTKTPAQLPVFFVITKNGTKELRNFAFDPMANRLLVHGVFDHGELRLGAESVYLDRI